LATNIVKWPERKEAVNKRISKGLFGLSLFMPFTILSSADRANSIVGNKAPDFKAEAVVLGEPKEIKLSDFEGKNKVLIFYPADFSFICPTELFAIQDKLKEFEQRDAIVIAISVDQIYSHEKWLETPRKEGGIQGITYPIASDITKKISRDYMTLDDSKGIALRGLFIIDKNDIVQAASVYNMNIGRNTDEILRILDAIIFTQEHGQVCPANWAKGQAGLDATEKGLKEYLKEKK
jgi:peroxiredoxin (alkyl hydroperoxide reductase subunit C)